MIAAALALTLATPAPQTSTTAIWGTQEWEHGRGALSRHYFEYGDRYPSSHLLAYGNDVGSFYYLIFGNRTGSAYFWRYGRAAGSQYFWRYGRTAGSEYFWRYGRGCLSEAGWRDGATCSGPDVVVLQTACIARVVDIPPCQAVNARLDEWLATAGNLSSTSPQNTIDEMRQPLD